MGYFLLPEPLYVEPSSLLRPRMLPCDAGTLSCPRVSRLASPTVRACRCDGMEQFTPGQLALRTRGALLTDDSVLLSATGVSFCSRGSQLQDIFLYVPHLIS